MSDLPTLNPEPFTKYKIYFCRRWHTDQGEIKNHWDAWTETYDSLEEAEERIATLTQRVQIWEAVTQFRRVK